MFKAAEDKYGYAEKDCRKTENIAQLFSPVSFDRKIHKDSAEKCQNEQTYRIIVQFGIAYIHYPVFDQGKGAGVAHQSTYGKTAAQIAQPDQEQGDKITEYIGTLLRHQVTDGAGEKFETVTEDSHQGKGK